MNKITLKTIFPILSLMLMTHSHAENTFQQELKQNCSKIASAAKLGKKLYDQKQYKKALEQFKFQLAWSNFCTANSDESGMSFSDQALDVTRNNVGLTYARMNQPGWARAWYEIDSTSRASQYNLKQLPKAKSASDLSGEYVSYAGFGEWDHITVNKRNGRYEIAYSGLYMGIRSLIYGPNMGEFDTHMPVNKTQTTFKYDDCKIDLNFKTSPERGNFIEVKQNDGASGCGFGHNVYAGGTYLKVEK